MRGGCLSGRTAKPAAFSPSRWTGVGCGGIPGLLFHVSIPVAIRDALAKVLREKGLDSSQSFILSDMSQLVNE